MQAVKIISFSLIISLTVSCSNFYGDENLGSGYFIWKDGRYKSIVYKSDESLSDGGYSVIEKNVLKAKSNESYLIVLTSDLQNTGEELHEYWLIDKTVLIDMDSCNDQASCDKLLKSNVTGPLDSLSFSKIIEKQNIHLVF